MTIDFTTLHLAHPCHPIRGCPGRLHLVGASHLSALAIVGEGARTTVHRVAGARDPVHVTAIAGGGLISYERSDGVFIHTLNTDEGFARKLAALGIVVVG